MAMQRTPSTRPSSTLEFIDESAASIFEEIPIIKGYVKNICNKYRKKDCQTHVKITKSMDDLSNYDQAVLGESLHRKSEEYLLEITNNPVDEIAQEMHEKYSETESKTILIKIIVTKVVNKRDNEKTNNECISDDKKLAHKKAHVNVILETPNENNDYNAKVCTSGDVYEETVTPKQIESIEHSLNNGTTKPTVTIENIEITIYKPLSGQTLSNTILQNETERTPKEVNHSSAKDETVGDLLAGKQKSPSPPILAQKDVIEPILHKKSAYTENSVSKGAIPKQFTTKKHKTGRYSPTDEANNEDSIKIHDIVMERFQKTLNESTQRRTTRQLSRKNPSLSDDRKMEEQINSSVNVHFKQAKKIQSAKGVSFDSGIQDATAELLKSNSFENCKYLEEDKEIVEYNSSEFLRAALGDELLDQTGESQEIALASSTPFRSKKVPIQGSERSIGSSDVSMLLSNVDQSIYSLYSTIKKPIKKTSVTETKMTVSRPLFKSFSSNNSYDYASIRKVKLSQDVEKLTKEVSDLENTIYQVTKALSICRNNPKIFGQIPHIEAEKVLLVASYKKNVLNSEINEGDYQEIELNQYLGIMQIENLKFLTGLKGAERKNVTQYYLCVLQSGITVLASDIITPDANEVVTFTNQFEFKELVPDFKIHLSIYGMDIENNEKNTSFCLKRQGSLRKNKKTIDNDPTYTETSSFFRLLGKCQIGKCEVIQGHNLKLDYISPKATISEVFVADFRGSVEIHDRSVGFLNISTRCLLWEKRWCVLDGSRLKYWNYPSDQFVKKPIGTIDLNNCISHQATNVDKRICARPRTFMLKVNIEGIIPAQKIYLFSADNLMECNEWKRQLNSRLAAIKYWTDLKSQAIHTDV